VYEISLVALPANEQSVLVSIDDKAFDAALAKMLRTMREIRGGVTAQSASDTVLHWISASGRDRRRIVKFAFATGARMGIAPAIITDGYRHLVEHRNCWGNETCGVAPVGLAIGNRH
jgi:hypothetical protein